MNKLKEVLQVQSSSGHNGRMMSYIKSELKAMGLKFYSHGGNLYTTKGKADIYPCIVSHTDTVHPIYKDYKIINNNGYFLAISGAKQVGTGGDDKVGIFICLQMLRVLPVLKAAFFIDEEVGCIGSSRSDANFFNNVGYVLQADRRGAKDVTESINGVDMISEAFKGTISGIMTKYGRSYVDGMMTDVEALSKKYDVSMFNCSCGYYEPHSLNEYVIISEVAATFEFMKECIIALGNNTWDCKHEYLDWGKERGLYHEWDRWDLDERKYSKVRAHTVKDRCPSCYSTETQFDETMNDTYCFGCGLYYSEMVDHFRTMNRRPLDLHELF